MVQIYNWRRTILVQMWKRNNSFLRIPYPSKRDTFYRSPQPMDTCYRDNVIFHFPTETPPKDKLGMEADGSIHTCTNDRNQDLRLLTKAAATLCTAYTIA
jgi:hypothetical protein